jgi:hypothetical protein
MTDVLACPFCRETYASGRTRQCPACGLALVGISELPPATTARAEEDEPVAPEDETLPWTSMGRGRGALLVLSILGVGAFFLPWVHETMPERQTLDGLALGRHLGWIWAPLVAWFVLFPLVLSRRTIRRMRGARVAVCFLAGIALVTVMVRVAFPPPVSRIDPHVLRWGVGLWSTGALALAAVAVGFRFGGTIERIRSHVARRPDDATLH